MKTGNRVVTPNGEGRILNRSHAWPEFWRIRRSDGYEDVFHERALRRIPEDCKPHICAIEGLWRIQISGYTALAGILATRYKIAKDWCAKQNGVAK